jgi:hypothetical protein
VLYTDLGLPPPSNLGESQAASARARACSASGCCPSRPPATGKQPRWLGGLPGAACCARGLPAFRWPLRAQLPLACRPMPAGNKGAKTHTPTDEAALKQLQELHELPGLVLEFRCMQVARRGRLLGGGCLPAACVLRNPCPLFCRAAGDCSGDGGPCVGGQAPGWASRRQARSQPCLCPSPSPSPPPLPAEHPDQVAGA